MKRTFVQFLMLLASIALLNLPVCALNYPDGSIVEVSTIWSSNDNVTIQGSLTFQRVDTNKTLEIQAGTHIYLAEGARVVLNGFTLTAQGTDADSIYFRPLNADSAHASILLSSLSNDISIEANMRFCSFANLGTRVDTEGLIKIEPRFNASESAKLKLSHCGLYNVLGSGVVVSGETYTTDTHSYPSSCVIDSSVISGSNHCIPASGVHIVTHSTPGNPTNNLYTGISIKLTATAISNFGYTTHAISHPWDAGSGVRISGQANTNPDHLLVQLKIIKSSIQNCGNGVLSVGRRQILDFVLDSSTIRDVSGSACWLYQRRLFASMRRDSISCTGLDAINIGKGSETLGEDVNGDSLFVRMCLVDSVGFLRRDSMTTQANGIHIGAGGFIVHLKESVVRHVFSNGVKLYEEHDSVPDLAKKTLFWCEGTANPAWPIDTVVFPNRMAIYDCGYTFGVENPTEGSRYYHGTEHLDHRHGIRFANQEQTNHVSIRYAEVTRTMIARNAGAGIAIRGNGDLTVHHQDSLTASNIDDHWKTIYAVLGSSIAYNENGIDMTDNENCLTVTSIPNETVWGGSTPCHISNNRLSGIRARHGEDSADTVMCWNRVNVQRQRGSIMSVQNNGQGGINFIERYEDDDHTIRHCLLQVSQGVNIQGTDDANTPFDYGVSLESDFADTNIIYIGMSPIYIPRRIRGSKLVNELPPFSDDVPIRIHQFGRDGIYVSGKRNTAIVQNAEIYKNWLNGIFLDARAASSPVHRDSLGIHALYTIQLLDSLNSKNGILVLSSGDGEQPAQNFGGSFLHLTGSRFVSNRDSAGVWLEEYRGKLVEYDSYFINDLLYQFQHYGLKERSYSHTDSLYGGLFARNLLDGIRIDTVVSSIQMSLTNGLNGGRYIEFQPYGPVVPQVGPYIVGNLANGVHIPGSNSDRSIVFHANAACFAYNAGPGVYSHIELSEGSGFRQCRFVDNGVSNVLIQGGGHPRNATTYFHNEFIGSHAGLFLTRAPREFKQNVIDRPLVLAMFVDQTGNTADSSIFAHNTIISADSAGITFQGVTGLQCRSNVIIVGQSNGDGLVINGPTALVHDNVGWNTGNANSTWDDITTNAGPDSLNSMGNPRLYCPPVPDPQINLFGRYERYRYHLQQNSLAIDATRYKSNGSSERDHNNTLANAGAFGGQCDTTALQWRESQICVIPPTEQIPDESFLQNCELSGEVRSESYLVLGHARVHETSTLSLEQGVELQFFADEITNPMNRGSFTIYGTLETMDFCSSVAPYTLYNEGYDTLHTYFRANHKWVSAPELRQDRMWDTLKFASSMAMEGANLKNLWIEQPIQINIEGDITEASSPLTFLGLTYMPYGESYPSDGKLINIRNRKVNLQNFRMYNTGKYDNNLIGIYAGEEPSGFTHTVLTIDSLTMFDIRGDNSNTASWRNIWIDNLGAAGTGEKSFTLTHGLINDSLAGDARQYTSPEEANGAGICIVNSTFLIDSVQVLNKKSSNAIELRQIPYDPTNYSISNSRFAGTQFQTGPFYSNGLFLNDANPYIELCDFDHNGNSGVYSMGSSVPCFYGRAGTRGSRIFDNMQLISPMMIVSDSINDSTKEIAQYTIMSSFATRLDPAPIIAFNSIFTSSFDPQYVRNRLHYRSYVDDVSILDNGIKFNGVWWGQPNSAGIGPRVIAYTTDTPFDEITQSPLFINQLLAPPDSNVWDPVLPIIVDVVGRIRLGEYDSAAVKLMNVINDTSADWTSRAHAIPLLFGVNQARGWTEYQNLDLWDSFVTQFDSTDMYPVVRNYKPLLYLLHDKPEQAYATYQQFQMFPLCFEDSIASAIALVELAPVMGPENKQGIPMLTEHARISKVDELNRLLAARRRGTAKPLAESLLPSKYELHHPYPNPFNSTVQFRFELPKAGITQYLVYDALGREVWREELGTVPAGRYYARWDGKNHSGIAVSSGMYFLRFTSGNFHSIKKIVMVK